MLRPALAAHPESDLLLWQVLLPPLSSLEVRGTPEYEEVVRKDKDGKDQTQRVLVWNVSGALSLSISRAAMAHDSRLATLCPSAANPSRTLLVWFLFL